MKLNEVAKIELPIDEELISESCNLVLDIATMDSASKVYRISDGIEVNLIENVNLANCDGRVQFEYIVGSGAKLNHIIVGNIQHSKVSLYREYSVYGNGLVEVTAVNLNSGEIMEQNICNLIEKGARAEVKLITIASGGTKSEYRTDINNLNLETFGDILQRGVVMSGGENVFSGVGFIKKGAHKSHNEQESRVLLLEGAKRGDANPLLLIDDYDVIAGHAASSGKISNEDLYYLMSRGITRNQAEKMITIGFLMPVINEIKDETIVDLLKGRIDKELYG